MLKLLGFIALAVLSACTFGQSTSSSSTRATQPVSCDEGQTYVPVSLVAPQTMTADVGATHVQMPDDVRFQLRLDYCADDMSLTALLVQYAIVLNGEMVVKPVKNVVGDAGALVFNNVTDHATFEITDKIICSGFTAGCEKFMPRTGLVIQAFHQQKELFVVVKKWSQDVLEVEKLFSPDIFGGQTQVGMDRVAGVLGQLVCPVGMKQSHNILKADTLTVEMNFCLGGHSDALLFELQNLTLTDSNKSLPESERSPVFLKFETNKDKINLIVDHHNFNDSLAISFGDRSYKFEVSSATVVYSAAYQELQPLVQKSFACDHFFFCPGEGEDD